MKNKNISPLYKFSLKGGGRDEQRQPKVQPSAEIVRVECAKCRRKCDSPGARATLYGDRACRVRETGLTLARPSALIVCHASPSGYSLPNQQ